jgi:hypothetical protein
MARKIQGFRSHRTLGVKISQMGVFLILPTPATGSRIGWVDISINDTLSAQSQYRL